MQTPGPFSISGEREQCPARANSAVDPILFHGRIVVLDIFERIVHFLRDFCLAPFRELVKRAEILDGKVARQNGARYANFRTAPMKVFVAADVVKELGYDKVGASVDLSATKARDAPQSIKSSIETCVSERLLCQTKEGIIAD